MFDIVQKHNIALKVLLGAIALSFVVIGVGSFSVEDDPNYVAKVDGEKISRQELARALRNGEATPQSRRAALQSIVNQRLLVAEAKHIGLAVSDDDLRKMIASEPSLQENGAFSAAKYEALLKSQNMTSGQLEQSLRRDILVQQLTGSLLDSAFVSQAAVNQLEGLLVEQRDFQKAVVTPAQFIAQVKLDAGAARQYYDKHQAEFQKPEQVKLEYLVLSQQDIADQIKLTDDEIQQFAKDHNSIGAAEQRQVSHILLAVDPKASAADKAKVKTRAEELLAVLKAHPDQFAELAKKNSQDPGSAKDGGSMPAFGHGAMVKPFEDAAFSMTKGEIRGPVETQFGFHIIKLEDVKTPSFDEIKPQIEAQLKTQKAAQQYQTAVDKFNTTLYQKADSLKPAADEFKLTIKTSDWVSRKAAADPLLNNPKLLEAVFSDDVLNKKHNSDAVEVEQNTLVAARVAEHRPAAVQTFADAEPGIVAKLTSEKANEMAQADGKAKLAQLQAGKDAGLSWSASQSIQRMAGAEMDGDIRRALFRLNVKTLPAYAGINTPVGYALYKITKVGDGPKPEGAHKQIGEQLRQLSAQGETRSYLGELAKRYKVEVRRDRLDDQQ